MSSSTKRSGDTLSFNPIRELLNPKFETYKLESSSISSTTSNFTLPNEGFKLRTLPDHARLSYSEVQARVRHNHLSPGLLKGGEIIFVDGDLKVMRVELDSTGTPIFHQLIQLPTHLSSSTLKRLAEYPTALPLKDQEFAISDGFGRIYIVELSESEGNWKGTILFSFELEVENEGGELAPFRLHHVIVLPTGEILALLSTAEKIIPLNSNSNPIFGGPTGLSTTARTKIPSTTVFDFTVIDISAYMKSEEKQGGSKKAIPIWKLRGLDQPSSVAFDSDSLRYIISSPTGFFNLDQSTSASTSAANGSSTESTTSTRPRTTSNFIPASLPSPSLPTIPSLPIHKPPPFSWTQESSSLTVAFALPSTTPTSSIRVTFSRQFLSIHIGSPASSLQTPTTPTIASVHTYKLPHVSHKKLWDVMNPHTSVWTFDREAEGRDSTFGLLSLHLEKINVGTRWSEVFTPSDRMEVIGGIREGDIGAEEREMELEGVDETLDINQLADIAESMEKWTTGLEDGAGGGGVGADNEGMGMGLPSSLMGEEIDVEVDGESGRPIVITWIEDILSSTPKLVKPHPTVPYSLLSIPLPTSDSSSSIVIQHDVDGLLFTPPTTLSTSYQWTHTSTFPALAFVLATKRDAYFVYHYSNKAVFAFDSPSNISTLAGTTASLNKSGAGNLFVYFSTKEIKDKFGKQVVVRIGSGNSGNLLGVTGVEIDGKLVVVVLCEKELVVIRVF